MKNRNWLVNSGLIAAMALCVSNCTAVRTLEVLGNGRTSKETRTTRKLASKEVNLTMSPRNGGFFFRLQYEPHYQVQSRSITRYSEPPQTFSWVLGLAEALVLAYVVREAAYSEESDGFEFEWSALETWQKAIVIGVPIDGLLGMVVSKDFTRRSDWKQSGTLRGNLEGIRDRDITVSFPQFGFKDTYRTDHAGKMTIPKRDLVTNIPHPKLNAILNADSIKVDASFNVAGREQLRSFMVPLSRAFFRGSTQEDSDPE